MNLIEIKNNLSKIYYEPASNQLVLSDFLTIDDNNKKILAQIISIETTSNKDTNCAIAKFSLEFDENNSLTTYSGYVPTLNANVTKTQASVLASIFSNAEESLMLGNLSSSADIALNVDVSLLDNFLYIQSDNIEEKQNLFAKIAQYNNQYNRKTLVADFDNLTDYQNVKVVEMGLDFKLPISIESLNYIYENDLNGLTIEEKAIVQDIILEIQEYTKTLKDGYIPFNTLLDVVNNIYEAEKSTGIILLRNKLLKYNQQGLFASNNAEIISLINAINENNVVVLKLSKIETKWQQEAIAFVLDNIDEQLYLIANISEGNVNKEILTRMYKQANIVPIIGSNYAYEYAIELKAFAKNIILFKPQQQQKAYATYNSFLSKLAKDEFVISGVTTHYTPLIVKELSSVLLKRTQPTNTSNVPKNQEEKVLVNDFSKNTEETVIKEDEVLIVEDSENISLEDEIAKDVDSMFYGNIAQSDVQQISDINNDDILLEEDLEIFDELEAQDELLINEENSRSENDDAIINIDENNELISIIDETTPNNDEFIELDSQVETVEDQPIIESIDNGKDEIVQDVYESNIVLDTEPKENSSIPVYTTNDDKNTEGKNVKIAEGNIVYHPKYGKGTVEELFNYGSRTLCSIQFEGVGIRLLDPNLADLKQL